MMRTPRRLWSALASVITLSIAAVLLARSPAFAQSACPEVPDDGVLRVAVREAPPFTFRDPIDPTSWDGLAVEMWTAIANRLDVEFRYVELGLNEGMAGLVDCEVEVIISPLTITAEREELYDFSQQYFRSGLTFAAPYAESVDLGETLATLRESASSTEFLVLVGALFMVNLVFVILTSRRAAAYRDIDALEEKGRPWRWFHFAMYSFVTSTGMSDDIFAFRSVKLQFLTVLNAVIGTAVAAGVIGLIAASMTSSVLTVDIHDLNDLERFRVVVLANSTAEQLLDERRGGDARRFEFETVRTLAGALQRVENGSADVVFGDWAQLAFLTRHRPFLGELVVQNETYRFEPYGLGMAQGSPWRERIDRELLTILRSDGWKPLVRRYMGEGDITPQ